MKYRVVTFQERPDLYDIQEEICGKAFPTFLYYSEIAANTWEKMIGTCKQAVEIKGTVAQWETWTSMKFPESGRYVVDGALCPVRINRESNLGIYTEPNVWVSHETLSNVE